MSIIIIIIIEHPYSTLTKFIVTSFEFPVFLNLLNEQIWYQPLALAVNVPLKNGAVSAVPSVLKATLRTVE